MYRCYTTERPLTPGSVPRQREAVNVVNYNKKKPVIVYSRKENFKKSLEIYGYVDYEEALTKEEIEDYELVEVYRND